MKLIPVMESVKTVSGTLFSRFSYGFRAVCLLHSPNPISNPFGGFPPRRWPILVS